MKCLAILLALISTSALADGFYVQTDLSVQKRLAPLAHQANNFNGEVVMLDLYRPYDINVTRNPYIAASLGYAKDTKLFSIPIEWHVEGYHRSSISTGSDQGITAINIGLKVWIF